jgi:hypothetical protein
VWREPRAPRRIAVALHDVEPATFERCALIRDWLDDHGVTAVTLLVIPAADGHPIHQRSPALVDWLWERRARGDAIAQLGFVKPPRASASELSGLNRSEARDRVIAGQRLLNDVGLCPTGFVAPGYVYPRGLGRDLWSRFDWWGTLLRCRPGSAADSIGGAFAPALAPGLLRACPWVGGSVLRLDLHPAEFVRTRHVLALESVLRRAEGRLPVTYDDLLAPQAPARALAAA